MTDPTPTDTPSASGGPSEAVRKPFQTRRRRPAAALRPAAGPDPAVIDTIIVDAPANGLPRGSYSHGGLVWTIGTNPEAIYVREPSPDPDALLAGELLAYAVRHRDRDVTLDWNVKLVRPAVFAHASSKEKALDMLKLLLERAGKWSR